MKKALRTFRSVEITTDRVEASGLKYIFRQMVQPQSLGINVRKSNDEVDMTYAFLGDC